MYLVEHIFCLYFYHMILNIEKIAVIHMYNVYTQHIHVLPSDVRVCVVWLVKRFDVAAAIHITSIPCDILVCVHKQMHRSLSFNE